MNALIQDGSFVIGSLTAVEELSQKDKALLLVLSDSHGAETNLELPILEFGEKCDAIVFCGDGLSEFTRLLEKSKTDSVLSKCIPPVVAAVSGNNDFGGYVLNGEHITFPLSITLNVCGHPFYITHGHRHSLFYGYESLAQSAYEQNGELCIFGHTHVALRSHCNGVFLLNPGSCARPRGGQPPSFATLQVSKESWNFDSPIYALVPGKIHAYNPENLQF